MKCLERKLWSPCRLVYWARVGEANRSSRVPKEHDAAYNGASLGRLATALVLGAFHRELHCRICWRSRMKNTLVPGVRGEARHRVVTENLVSYRKPEAPSVLSTPWLLSIMETAAYEAIRPHLDAGESSVGTGFNFDHLAPTPAGDTVLATAVVTGVEKNRVQLDFEARDSRGVIAKGKHVRAVIDKERFRKRLERNGSSAESTPKAT